MEKECEEARDQSLSTNHHLSLYQRCSVIVSSVTVSLSSHFIFISFSIPFISFTSAHSHSLSLFYQLFFSRTHLISFVCAKIIDKTTKFIIEMDFLVAHFQCPNIIINFENNCSPNCRILHVLCCVHCYYQCIFNEVSSIFVITNAPLQIFWIIFISTMRKRHAKILTTQSFILQVLHSPIAHSKCGQCPNEGKEGFSTIIFESGQFLINYHKLNRPSAEWRLSAVIRNVMRTLKDTEDISWSYRPRWLRMVPEREKGAIHFVFSKPENKWVRNMQITCAFSKFPLHHLYCEQRFLLSINNLLLLIFRCYELLISFWA